MLQTYINTFYYVKCATCVMLQLLNTAAGKNREAKEMKDTESGCLFMPEGRETGQKIRKEGQR